MKSLAPLCLAVLFALMALAPVRAFTGITLISHVIAGTGSVPSPVTTGSIDSTGANFCVVVSSPYGEHVPTAPTVTDSKGNSYTNLTIQGTADALAVGIAYTTGPTFGSGHTFTSTLAGTNMELGGSCWSGVNSTPLEAGTDKGATNGPVSSIQPGSITPTVNGELLITGGIHCCNSDTMTVNSGFSVLDQDSGNFFYIGQQVQTTAGAINPTWSEAIGSDNMSAVIAAFKPTGGGGGSTVPPAILRNPFGGCCKGLGK